MSKFGHLKKIKQNKRVTILRHRDGHEIKIAHDAVGPDIKKELENMPIQSFSDGGDVSGYPEEDFSSKVKSDEDIIKDVQSYQPQENSEEKDPGILKRIDQSIFGNESGEKIPIPGEDIPIAQDLIEESPRAPAVAPTLIKNQSAAPSYEEGMTEAMNNQLQGQTQMAAAQGQLGRDVAIAQQERAKQDKIEHDNYLKSRGPIDKKSQELDEWLNKNPVNANRYVQNMSTGSKVLTLIGLMLGGFTAGRTGGENHAAKYLQNQIDNDLKAQENETANKRGLLQHYRQEGLDAKDAFQMARIANNEILNSALGAAQGKAQSAASAGSIQNVRGIIGLETEKMKHEMAIQRMRMGEPGSTTSKDPAKLVPILVPKEHQQKAFDEIEVAENTKKNAAKILESFDKAASNIHLVDFAPGFHNADQKSLHALMGPTFKDVEGTVRQAAMDNMFENVTPQFGDDKNTTDTKRKALVGYLQSKSSAPTARGYGIDLNKFGSTNASGSEGGTKNPLEGKTATGPSGQKITMQNGKWVSLK